MARAAASASGRRCIVIDVNWAFCGDRPEPILELIKRWRNSCGEDAWVALPYIRALIDKCHEKGMPVIYTTGVRRDDNWDSGSWLWKNSRGNEDRQTIVSNLDGNEIVTPIAPEPQDIVVLKQKPSGFFGSNMASYLTLLGCDSLIVTGTTTSGCVRATVLDGFSLNYRIALAEEGCFDRSQASHAINLCDMNAKYADVVKTAEVLAFFDTLPSGMYELPDGQNSGAARGQARREFLTLTWRHRCGARATSKPPARGTPRTRSIASRWTPMAAIAAASC